MRVGSQGCSMAVVFGALAGLAASPVRGQVSAHDDVNRVLAPSLPWFDEWMARTREPVPDFAAMKSCADLPPLLRFEDGAPVRTPAEWQRRRDELRRLLTRWILGTFPKQAPPIDKAEVLREGRESGAVRREVRVTFRTATPTADAVSLVFEVLVPEGKGPFPVFMTQATHRRVGLIGLSRGYLVCVYPGADVDDQSDAFARAYPEADWGRIARRAWLASRVLDYIFTLPEADKRHVAITGHSRNGKQSMIAAAFDERFTAIVSSSSGTGGATPFRFVGEDAFEESVEFMSRQTGTADWFHPRIRLFTGREDKLPTDIHALVALIAPRACLLSDAYNDRVGTTFSVERNYLAGREVYRLLGRPEAFRIRWRCGAHEWNMEDAEAYFDWCDRAFGRGSAEFAEDLIHDFDWTAWKARQPAESLRPPHGADPITAIRWMLGNAPPRATDPGGSYGKEVEHEAALHGRDWPKTSGITRRPVSFGNNLAGDLFYGNEARAPLPVVIWLHPYSYSTGYCGAYMLGPRIYQNLAARGYAVFAFDQIGFGRRILEGRGFYRRYPHWSKLGKMVADVQAAIDFLTANAKPDAGARDLALPPLDTKHICCVGYSLGGMVGLYAAAMDDRIAGVASFCGFTPMRTDTDASPTGGIRRLWEWHGLLPRLGLYDGRERELPFDFDDVLKCVAPRPALIVSPLHDRAANPSDVRACVGRARPAWQSGNAAAALTLREPNDYNRFQSEQQTMLLDWLTNGK